MSNQPSDFTAYAIGVCYASVCTSLNDDAATARLNAEYPTGIGPWKIADEPFASGEPNGVRCNAGEMSRHLLFSC